MIFDFTDPVHFPPGDHHCPLPSRHPGRIIPPRNSDSKEYKEPLRVSDVHTAGYDVTFVMNSATGEIIFLYVDWQKLVTLLNPIRPQDMVALIHIAVVHNHDLDFARNLLLHCALGNPSLLTAAVIHEILISVPFSALLTKSSTTLKDIRSVMMSTISYIPELPQIAQAVEEGVLRTFGMAGGGRQQVSTNFGLKLLLDAMLAGSEQVLLKENEPFVLTPSLLLSPFLQKYNTKNMIFDFSLMYKGDLYVERELDLTEKERDRARRRRIRMYRSQLIQVVSEQGRNTKLFRDELDEVLPLPASPCTLIPKGVVSQSETATFVTTILFLMSKFSTPYTTHPFRVIKAVNQNTFSLLSDYSRLLTSGPLNAQSLSRLQRIAITGKAREQSNAEHCNTGYLSPLHHRILERMPDVVFTSTYIRHKLRTLPKTM
ncbi:hypothetical protein BLNAU_23658 [Blattamonas nauphoetae]|uniref:Uncharacterized protein n=1 Tax=Blattamonas nauphoetae TaxID=2049346 RepID=A0ABQ9WPN6_9EUKA|nr:hypothetical protein BLNAU_23658 [Blattamonas nauphoetae]